MSRPRLALTLGDPAGIGPEIVLRALASPECPRAEWVVYGPQAAWPTASRASACPRFDGPVVDVGGRAVRCSAGSRRRAGGRRRRRCWPRPADALAGRVDGVVTAPLHKESLRAAGHPWPGHTEMLAEAAAVSDVAMMFVGGGLRVALLTIHRSLRSVPDAITGREVERVVRLVHRELPRLRSGGGGASRCAG